ncbi:MAG: PilN domain-containing protein [Nitrospira sp.]|nr:PilN domain-containing protein [Nitrospira sp.]MDH4303109.1 PilN domain-containing protein [Nitrospira sp.]
MRSLSRAGRQFEINVASRYRVGMASYRTWLVGGCIALLLSIAWNIWQGVLVYEEGQTIEAELERVRQLDHTVMAEARKEGIDLSDGALKRLSSEVDLANQLLMKRTFSWTTFLSELEQVIPPRLALTSVRLDQSAKTVQLTGTAVSLEDITAFTVGLQNHATFKDPVLAQHRVGSSGLVEFDVTVQYRQTGV